MSHEQELILNFDTMVSEERERNEPTDVFEGWSDDEKVKYRRQLEFNLPQHSEAENLKDKEVPDSVVFYLTDPEQVQENYVAAIGHYRSWQYAGSDRRMEFGSKKQRTFVTRSTGTFVFYYRFKLLLVGLIIDGQSGWVEGAITRNVRDSHEAVLQFARKGFTPDYIRSARTHTLRYDGNYTKAEEIYKIKIGIWQLCNAVQGIGEFVPGVSKSEPDPAQWQILVIFAPEAGRINHIFGQTKKSVYIDPDEVHVPNKIPSDLEPFVLNYLKLSKSAIDVLDGNAFLYIKGTTPRNLYQVLLAVLILRRKVVYPTHFMLPDAPPMKYKREEPDQGKRGNTLTDEQKLEAANAKGTRYQVGKHDGTSIYHPENWLTEPFKQVERSFPKRPEIMMVLIWLRRLRGYLSKNAALSDCSGVQSRLSNESLNLNGKKNLPVAAIRAGNSPNKDESPTGGSDFSMQKSGVASRTKGEICYGEPRSRLPVALGTDNGKVPEIMKRRGIARETDRMDASSKKARLMVAEHERRCHVNSSTQDSEVSAEEVDSSTDILTNVHFAATDKALPIHFMKCQPKGTAYVTFSDKGSTESSTSLPGTSLSSRLSLHPSLRVAHVTN